MLHSSSGLAASFAGQDSRNADSTSRKGESTPNCIPRSAVLYASAELPYVIPAHHESGIPAANVVRLIWLGSSFCSSRSRHNLVPSQCSTGYSLGSVTSPSPQQKIEWKIEVGFDGEMSVINDYIHNCIMPTVI